MQCIIHVRLSVLRRQRQTPIPTPADPAEVVSIRYTRSASYHEHDLICGVYIYYIILYYIICL